MSGLAPVPWEFATAVARPPVLLPDAVLQRRVVLGRIVGPPFGHARDPRAASRIRKQSGVISVPTHGGMAQSRGLLRKRLVVPVIAAGLGQHAADGALPIAGIRTAMAPPADAP